MSEEQPKPPFDPPPPIPRRGLPYSEQRQAIVRAVGSVSGKIAVGFVTFAAPLGLGWVIMQQHPNTSGEVALAPAGLVLMLGVAAAFIPRYRGVLGGMLLVILILIGLVLLLIGICFMAVSGGSHSKI